MSDCSNHGACPSVALKTQEIEDYKAKVNSEWQLLGSKPQKISRDFSFNNYMDGVNFAAKVADIAEKLNHHPDILIGFKKVKVEYYTHNADGLTHMDFDAATMIDKLFSNNNT